MSNTRYISQASARYGVPETVIRALIKVESGGNANAKSPAGARGLTQFMPGTAKGYGVRFGSSPRARRSQIVGAAHYLSDLGYRKNPRKALASYNAGPGNYQAGLGYASKVIGIAKQGGGSIKGGKGGGSLGSGGGLSVSVTPGQVEPGNAAIVDLLNPPKPVQPSGMDIPEPSFSAHNKLPVPAGYQAPPAVGAPQPSSLSDQLRAIQQIPGTDIPKTTINVTGTPGSPGGGGKVIGGGHYPLGKRGKVIGTPYKGTHTLGDWESDNAVDVSVPKGTPVRAVQSGVIGSQIGSLGRGGRFAGLRVHLDSKDNEYYYAHLSRLTVKAGQRVKRGQIIGYSGEANGVQHLHFGQRKGDPRRTVR